LPNTRKFSCAAKDYFLACANGAEASHFNRMLIGTGLIKNP
jgi:hypothetical protein